MMRKLTTAAMMMVTLTFAACEGANSYLEMSKPGMPAVPAVSGYADGQKIRFMHTEASDAQVADTLSAMMRSPVLVVPALAQTPQAALAKVYVFTNGVQPAGPRGPFEYQPDVFDCAPPADCYSPLRSVHLVAWRAGAGARVLKSAAEVEQAEQSAQITVEPPGIVVNMPFLEWSGGKR